MLGEAMGLLVSKLARPPDVAAPGAICTVAPIADGSLEAEACSMASRKGRGAHDANSGMEDTT
jgi:hypothetical protein